MAVLLVIGGLLVGGMIGVSMYGAMVLPPGARVPIRRGISGFSNYRSRKTGLIAWPASGLLIYGLMVGVYLNGVKPNHASPVAALIIMPIALALVLAVQIGAIKVARKGHPRPF